VGSTIVDWLDRAALEHPDRAAAEDGGGRSIGYAEMAALSRRLQCTLAKAGVRPGDRVAIFMRKSIDSLVAFQAALRCGAAYVPTDPLAPARRAAFMVDDCEACAVIVDADLEAPLRQALPDGADRWPCLVVPPEPVGGHRWRIAALADDACGEAVAGKPTDLAFLLYTSGSTGKPKGVMVTHDNVIDFVDWCSDAFSPNERDKLMVHGPLHFSLPVFNLYVAWRHGATVVAVDERTASAPQLLGPVISERGVTVWFSTPTILSLLAQTGQLPALDLVRLRLVMFGGEAFPPEKLRALAAQVPHARYVHVLGSTETHIMAHYEVGADVLQGDVDVIPVGKISRRFRSRILDDRDSDVSPGTDGELCLSGRGVAAGYWKEPTATARAFYSDSRGVRWYRTGDIVRERPDGNLVFLGRRDRMIKKRGNRIELAEIEACLGASPEIKEVGVVAIVHDEEGPRIVAFVARQEPGRPTIIELKALCAKHLPQYMAPDVFRFCDALPRTSNGKIDYPKLTEMCDGQT
jgi:amino acid adenylation domain-containing protein